MSWRSIVVTGIAKLDYKLDFLVIRKKDQTVQVFLDEVGVLIIESTAVSITTALLCELVKKKIKVIFCDEKHNPISELMPYYGSHDTSAKVRLQIRWDDYVKKTMWSEIVKEKIRQQMYHLQEHLLMDQAAMLHNYIPEVDLGDETNREGHAAKVYFNALFGLDFTRSEDSFINAALNYGYSILLSYFCREIVSIGYITQLGLFHDNMFNQYNLASDLMEPFRVIVDRKVCRMDFVKFDTDEKHELLNMMNETVVIDGKHNSVANAIKIYCRSIFEALNEKDMSLIKFYRYEL